MSGLLQVVKTGGSNLKMIILVTLTGECEKVTSKDTIVDDVVKVRFKWVAKTCKDEQLHDKPEVTFEFSLSKCDKENKTNIQTNITSEALNYVITNLNIPKKWSKWEVMGSLKPTGKTEKPWLCHTSIDILLTVYEVKTEIIYSPKLYSDLDFTDFSLTTTEGSVPVHKACLAAHSDVFKAMLTGKWKETIEGQVNIQGVTLRTLQQLKAYLYLGSVPNVNVGELCSLLLLAKCYLIKDLEKHCIRKIAETVSAEELFSIIEFACENQIPELPFVLLQVTKDSVVSKAYRIQKNKGQ